MKTFKAFLNLLVLIVAIAVTMSEAALANTRSSAHYNIRTDTVDAGGLRTASTHYGMDDSISGIGGISIAVSPAITARDGYIGQLYEVTSMLITAIPVIVSEVGNSQLGAMAKCDDGTILLVTPPSVNWGSSSYPIASISASGLVTPSAVYTDTTGTVSGYFLGASNSISLLVLDTNPDNFGIYASDTTPDSWQILYFGTNNPDGIASADADGTGQNNLFKYLAGLNPTNPASILRVTSVAKQGNDVRVTWTCVGGHSYILQSTKAAAIASYNTNFADASPIVIVPGVGESTTNYLDVGVAYAPVLTPPGSPISSTNIPSTINASSTGTRGIADSLGGALPIGSLLMLGTFNINQTTIQSNFSAGNVGGIMSNFVPYSTSFKVGDGTALPATWSVSRSAAGFAGQRIYLLAVDTPTLAKANHLGIYTAPSWVFPDDGDQTDIDLADVTDFVIGVQGGALTINLPVGGQTYTFDDTARLSVLPGRILFYHVRLVP